MEKHSDSTPTSLAMNNMTRSRHSAEFDRSRFQTSFRFDLRSGGLHQRVQSGPALVSGGASKGGQKPRPCAPIRTRSLRPFPMIGLIDRLSLTGEVEACGRPHALALGIELGGLVKHGVDTA